MYIATRLEKLKNLLNDYRWEERINEMFDDDTQNTFENPANLPRQIVMDFAHPVEIKRYMLEAQTGARMIRDWTLEYSDDISGSPQNWTIADTRTSVTWAGGEQKLFDV